VQKVISTPAKQAISGLVQFRKYICILHLQLEKADTPATKAVSEAVDKVAAQLEEILEFIANFQKNTADKVAKMGECYCPIVRNVSHDELFISLPTCHSQRTS
jgi:hypothetical protein